ncbi:2-oxo acid dehydrogenase subunit E2 [Spiroplasma endosymbiont of Amphibalanus improvisus]|uniref:2-oxo acid dehydrogenase subunit E2 n=1 Tax=Spiroplasma endosymbiont of Amphibalanus improvisus TaxID=3066327 RepID=UPI00313C73FE
MVDIFYKSEKNRNGLVDNINIKGGEAVEKGQLLAVILTQKMNYEIVAPSNGYIENILISENQVITSGTKIFDFQETIKKTIPINQQNNINYNDTNYYEVDNNLSSAIDVNKTSILREQMIQKLLDSDVMNNSEENDSKKINVDRINDLLVSLDAEDKLNKSINGNENNHIESLDELENNDVREKYNILNNQSIQRYNRKQNPFFKTENIFQDDNFKNKISNLFDQQEDKSKKNNFVDELEQLNVPDQNIDAFVDKTIEYPDSTFFIEEDDVTDILDGKRKIKPSKKNKESKMSKLAREMSVNNNIDNNVEPPADITTTLQNLQGVDDLKLQVEKIENPSSEENLIIKELESFNKSLKGKNANIKGGIFVRELSDTEVMLDKKQDLQLEKNDEEDALVRIKNIESDVREIMNNAGLSYTEEINHTIDLGDITRKLNHNIRRREQFKNIESDELSNSEEKVISANSVNENQNLPVVEKSLKNKNNYKNSKKKPITTKSNKINNKDHNVKNNKDVFNSASLNKKEKVKYLKNKDVVINIHNDMKERISFLSKNSNNVPKNVFEYQVNIDKLLSLLKEQVKKYEDKNEKFYTASYFVKAVQCALDKYPIFNSYYNLKNNQIIIKNRKNIAVSVLTKNGTKYPSVKNMENNSISEINSKLVTKVNSLKESDKCVEDHKIISFLISDYSRMGVRPLSFTLLDHNLASLAISFNENLDDQFASNIKGSNLLLILSYNSSIIDLHDATNFVRHIGSLLNNPVLLT